MSDHYQLVADTIQHTVLDSALLAITVTQDGRELDDETGLYVLARSLDKAGLIDHRALIGEVP